VADTILLRIYAADCILLVIAATVRMVSWATQEERRRMRMVCTVLWLYLPVELGMDYATARWHLRQGTLLDLLWSVPFFYGGWRFLQMPMDEPEALTGRRARGEAAHGSVLLLQSLCPMLITLGVFGLAVSIAGQHAVLAMVSILLLLIVQGLLSGVIQVNYLQQRALLVKREQELEAANSGLERLSLVDPLTGIANRRQFTEAFEAEWKRSARRQENIAILMIDVDYFKSVNDLHGHAYGDECLVRIAQCLRGALKRGADLAARYGGEEFVIVLPETGLTGAIEVAERVQDRVGAQRMENEASPFGGEVTISIGIAAVLAEPEFAGAHARAALIDQADRALYLAKREGRNRIEIYDSSSVGFVPSAVVTERGQGTS
jgi:diguanylate cyclase (GGDEF)-like protein